MTKNKYSETCIFINSCDKTHDVAEYFLKSFNKFIINNYYEIFIGINKKEHNKKYNFLNYIYAPCSNWQIETLYQLNFLKKKGFKNVIHILDDFIFNKETNLDDLKHFLKYFKNEKIHYLCLKKMEECIFVSILNNFKFKKINKIRENYPYYSSLQISLWDIDYFIKNIENCKSIWNFERQQLTKNHYHVKKNFFHYKHIVEKGEWDYHTSNYIEKYLDSFKAGTRPFRKSFLGREIFILKKISFNLFGFLIMRIRGN